MKIILASQSPRRLALLESVGYTVESFAANIDESIPENMPIESVPLHLALKKAMYVADLKGDDIPVIAADTIVVIEGEILNKPTDAIAAQDMLTKLNGKQHRVITGCCIAYKGNCHQFASTTKVYFKELSDTQIAYYIDKYQPFDKAGAYAIQEWIGKVGVEKIEGDYYNVVGLPVNKIVDILDRNNTNE